MLGVCLIYVMQLTSAAPQFFSYRLRLPVGLRADAYVRVEFFKNLDLDLDLDLNF